MLTEREREREKVREREKGKGVAFRKCYCTVFIPGF